ncbi:MAG: phosphatase PAP2 family protein [Chloroflexota bacterium]
MIDQTAWRDQLGRHRWRLLALFGGVLAPLALFGSLAGDVWNHEGFDWDAPILRSIHGYATPAHDRLMVAVSTWGGARGLIPLCVVVAGILLWRRRFRDASFVVLAYGGAALLNAVAKALFHSARPALWLSPAPEHGYGFPSGHAMSSIALMTAFVVLAWPTRWRWPVAVVAVVAVLAIGLSRVYLGVHFPSDVLAAWLAGLAWTVGLHLILASRAVERATESMRTARRAHA